MIINLFKKICYILYYINVTVIFLKEQIFIDTTNKINRIIIIIHIIR
jgi:hypothetical protein